MTLDVGFYLFTILNFPVLATEETFTKDEVKIPSSY